MFLFDSVFHFRLDQFFAEVGFDDDFFLPKSASSVSRATLDVLRLVFEDRIISRGAYIVWPRRSCGLTLLHCYLWGVFKDKCYADKPETIDALKDNIREGIKAAHNRYCA